METLQEVPTAEDMLVDDVLLEIFSFLNAAELHKVAAPVCRRWASLALGTQLWDQWLPRELQQRSRASLAFRDAPEAATAVWLKLYHTNLLENPFFLMSRQQMHNPHDMSSPWQSVCPDRKTFVWEDDLAAGDPHRAASVPPPLNPYHRDPFLFSMPGSQQGRPHIIMPPRMWAEVRQTVDLMAAMRSRGFGLVDSIRFLDSGPHLCLRVNCGRTAWRTGNRHTFEYEVGLLVDDGSRDPSASDDNGAEQSVGGACAAIWHRSGILDGRSDSNWQLCQVHSTPEACLNKSIRTATVVLRARSYPGLIGGCFASPELVFVSSSRLKAEHRSSPFEETPMQQ